MTKIEQILETYGYTDPVELYNNSVEAYETSETPIITDNDFDTLKNFVLENNLIEFKAGIERIHGEKKPLFYPMLSIDTVKNSECGSQEKLMEILIKKHDGISHDDYSLSWKLDGIALQGEYDEGINKHILTRGERTSGVDVTHNAVHAFPPVVDKRVKAIIGEAVISKENFEKYLSHKYKNERNATSGIVSSKGDKRADLRQYIDFVAFKIVDVDGNVLCADKHKDMILQDGIEVPNFHINKQYAMNGVALFENITEFELSRPIYKWRTDGVIIRNDNADLDEIKDGLYHAYTAYKYDAVQAVTTIKDIEYRLCNNGALFPMGVLEPVDVDGSTVSSVSLFNYANMLNQGLFTGAKIIIVKSGDIIPHVEHVLEPVFETPEFREKHKIDSYRYDGVNIFSDEDLTELKFVAGIEKLGFKNVGDSLAKVLFDAGYESIFSLFDFGDVPANLKITKPIQGMFDQVTEMFKNVSLTKLIQSMRFHGIGETSSKKFAIAITGSVQYGKDKIAYYVKHYISENKPVIYEINFLDSEEFLKLVDVIYTHRDRINFDGIVEVISETAIKVVMTGSPKEFGFAKKQDFIKVMQEKGIEVIEVKNLKDADYLITDDLNSTSSKMKNAEKLGKPIKTYGEF